MLRSRGDSAPRPRRASSVDVRLRAVRLASVRREAAEIDLIQVRLEGAAFDNLLTWLHELEYREGLLVLEASISQAGSAGRVNATVRVGQGG